MLKKYISKIPGAVCALLLVWLALSYIDIVADNNGGAAVHSEYNLILVLNEYGKEARE